MLRRVYTTVLRRNFLCMTQKRVAVLFEEVLCTRDSGYPSPTPLHFHIRLYPFQSFVLLLFSVSQKHKYTYTRTSYTRVYTYVIYFFLLSLSRHTCLTFNPNHIIVYFRAVKKSKKKKLAQPIIKKLFSQTYKRTRSNSL